MNQQEFDKGYQEAIKHIKEILEREKQNKNNPNSQNSQKKQQGDENSGMEDFGSEKSDSSNPFDKEQKPNDGRDFDLSGTPAGDILEREEKQKQQSGKDGESQEDRRKRIEDMINKSIEKNGENITPKSSAQNSSQSNPMQGDMFNDPKELEKALEEAGYPPTNEEEKRKFRNENDMNVNKNAMRKNLEDMGILKKRGGGRNDPNGAGKGIENMLNTLEALFDNTPKVDWKYMVKKFLKNSLNANSDKWSKKGLSMERYYKIEKKRGGESIGKIVIAIDTSGSVSKDMLQTFYGGMYDITKQLKDLSDVDIIQFTSDVNTELTKSFRNHKELVRYFENLKNGDEEIETAIGGTNFESVFRYINEATSEGGRKLYTKSNLAGVIIFSDGGDNIPDSSSLELEYTPINAKRLLWVIQNMPNFGERLEQDSSGEPFGTFVQFDVED